MPKLLNIKSFITLPAACSLSSTGGLHGSLGVGSTLPKPPQDQPFGHPDSSLHWGLSVPRPGVVLSSRGHWVMIWARGCSWNQVVGAQGYCSTPHSVQEGPTPKADPHSNVSSAGAQTLAWSNSRGQVVVESPDCICRPLAQVSSCNLLHSQPSWGSRAPQPHSV